MSDKELIAALGKAEKRAIYYRTGEAELFRAAATALEARQVDEAAAWDEGWDAAVRGYDLPDSDAGLDLDPNPYRLGERHEPELTDDDLALDEFELNEPVEMFPGTLDALNSLTVREGRIRRRNHEQQDH